MIILARANSQGLDNIYISISSFKQNIKSCNAKWQRQRLKTVKTTIGLITCSRKANFARAAHFFCTFLCRCFLRLQPKNVSFFISRSASLSPFFALSFAGLPPSFSFSLYFSCSIFQIQCGRDNQSKLETESNRKLSNFNFECTKTLYRNNLKHIAFSRRPSFVRSLL